MKICTKCQKKKRSYNFVRDPKRPGGRRNICHVCAAAEQRRNLAKRKEARGEFVSKPPPPHKHVYVQYQNDVPPRCFKCFFWNERQRREEKIPATDEAARKRTRQNYHVGKAIAGGGR